MTKTFKHYLEEAETWPKIRRNLTKERNGVKHVGVENKNGSIWYLPVASDDTPIFTNTEYLATKGDPFKQQLAKAGIGFPEKVDGEYGKVNGQWMNQNDMRSARRELKFNSPIEKAERQNLAALKAAGIDIEAELEKARSGELPDSRIKSYDDLVGYLMQTNNIPDATPSRYKSSRFGRNADDSGTNYKDTSSFNQQAAKDPTAAAQDLLKAISQRKPEEPKEPAEPIGPTIDSGDVAPSITGDKGSKRTQDLKDLTKDRLAKLAGIK